MSETLKLSTQEIEKAIEKKCGTGIFILEYLKIERRKYRKLVNDYLNMLASSRSGSAIILAYSKDKNYLEAIEDTINKINENYKRNNRGR